MELKHIWLILWLSTFGNCSFGSTFDLGHLKNLDYLSFRLRAPNVEFPVRELHTRTQFHLVSGNKADFDEGMMKLAASPLQDPFSSSKAYALAVEVGFATVDPILFANTMSLYERHKRGRVNSPIVPSIGNIDANHWRWVRANYYYLTKNTKSLKTLIGRRDKTDKPTVATFVDGYVRLLIADIDNSSSYASEAIADMEEMFAVLEEAGDFGMSSADIGRVALHLGRAYFILYETSSRQEGYEYLKEASKYSQVARGGLELHLSPIFYAAALDFSADILDELIRHNKAFQKENYGPGYFGMLKHRRDRMRLLASPYR